MPSLPRVAAVIAVAAWLPLAAQQAQPGADRVRERYTKYEFRVPMRDGVRLFTSVYVPKDTSKRYPFLVTRTPYSVGPYGIDAYRSSLGPSEEFQASGFIFVYQDARGRYMSEGEFKQVRPHVPVKRGPQDVDESSDMYDTDRVAARATCRTTTAARASSACRSPASTWRPASSTRTRR